MTAKAKPKPSASPKTSPRSRMAIIQANVNYLLRRMLDMDDHYIKAVSEGVRKHYIRRVGVLGLSANGECFARLFVDVNWDGYHRRMKEGRTTVRVKSNDYDCSPELRAGMDVFKQECEERKLTIGWTLVYDEGLDKACIDEELGIKWGNPYTLAAGTTESETLYIEEVPEASIHMEFIDSPS